MAAVVMKSLFVLYEKPCSGEFHRRAPVEPAAQRRDRVSTPCAGE